MLSLASKTPDRTVPLPEVMLRYVRRAKAPFHIISFHIFLCFSHRFIPFLFCFFFCLEKPGLADLSVSPAGLAEFDYGFPSSILRDRGCQSDAIDDEFVNSGCSCVEVCYT